MKIMGIGDGVSKIVVIAEKPSVGRDLAKVLGCTQKGEGCLIGEGYIVTWAIGHLVTLCEPEEYDIRYKRWNRMHLPMLPEEMKLKVISKTKKQFQILKKLMNDKEVTSLICATDSGREGELIFRYIYHMAKCKKPFERLWISSMTHEAIEEGFRRLKSGKEYDMLYESARCRSEADWLVGMNASRAYTLTYNTLLSIGRVQTPTLAVIVKRQKEIDQFTPKDYWEVHCDFEIYKGTWFDIETKEQKIPTEEKAVSIQQKVIRQQGEIVEIQEEQKKVPPPLLYDLTELQREANKKFGYSAQKTLSIAQDLYEKRKLITYPRTDSRYLSQDMIPKIHSTLKKLQVEPYQIYIQKLLQNDKLPITKRIVDDSKVSDHHAIIPTDVTPKIHKLSEEEHKIFNLIVKRFITVFYPYHIYKVTKVITNIQQEYFLSKGNTILQLGWKELEEKEDEQSTLPILEQGQTVTVQDARIEKKQTQPPKPYTEASLLSAMENAGRFVEDEVLKEQLKESGLGTPATRAAIIERLIKVGYIRRKGKILYPTEKGMKLIEVVPEELKSPETTGKWEKGLTSISKGKLGPQKFIDSIHRYVQYLVEQSAKPQETVIFPIEAKQKTIKKPTPIGTCILCKQGSILENTKAFYCSQWKEGCNFTLWKSDIEKVGRKVNKKTVQEYLNNGGHF